MPLKLRPTGLGSGIDEDRADYTVYCGGWDVGRIYENRGGPDSLRWFWSMTVNGPMTRADRVATPQEAKAHAIREARTVNASSSMTKTIGSAVLAGSCGDFERPVTTYPLDAMAE
jgi:hypothetical protein